MKDASAVRNVSDILKMFNGEKITVVISAMGKTTNKLEEIVKAYQNHDRKMFMAHVDDLYNFHMDIMGELFHERHYTIFNEVEDQFELLRKKIDQPFPDRSNLPSDSSKKLRAPHPAAN